MKKNYFYRWLVVCVIAILLVGCKGNSKSQNSSSGQPEKTAMVILKRLVTNLNFAGSLSPIAHVNVMSPIDGVVKEMFFSYGNSVKKGEKLVTINSAALLKQFNTAVTNFITQKNDYFTSLTSYQTALTLYKYGINSREQMQTDESTHGSKVMAFYQARDTLDKILKLVHINSKLVENMTLESSRNINKIFKSKFDNIPVFAKGSGVALYPISSSDGKSGNKIQSGQEVKKNGLILSIGDLSGYTATFQVNEIQVNQIKEKMPVTVTGDAFPGIVLKGYIKSVATQANPGSTGGGMSMFDVRVNVPKVPQKAKKVIRVGMTCRIKLQIKGKPMLMVPIKAVTQQYSGGSFVMVVGADGKKKKTTVLTGLTTPDGLVAIINGLKKGQKVVVKND